MRLCAIVSATLRSRIPCRVGIVNTLRGRGLGAVVEAFGRSRPVLDGFRRIGAPLQRVACGSRRPGVNVEEIRSLEDLLDLQVIDSAIDHLLERRSGLPALADYKSAHRRLERLDGEIATTEETKRHLDLTESRVEGEMHLDEDKLVREERRLYAGGLSARDATHLRDEVEMLRKRISTREDEALALLEEQQALGATLAELGAQRERLRSEKAALEAAIGSEWKGIDAEIASLEAKKRAAVPLIEPGLLALYEEIRPTKEGVAAAPFADRTCGGCHLRHSAAEEVQVLKVHPPRCIHCRRILVPR